MMIASFFPRSSELKNVDISGNQIVYCFFSSSSSSYKKKNSLLKID
jgi:hypothetical protein